MTGTPETPDAPAAPGTPQAPGPADAPAAPTVPEAPGSSGTAGSAAAADPAPTPILPLSPDLWGPGRRRIFPDEQVWPPVPRPAPEPPGTSTQPFPAVPADPPPAAPRAAAPDAAAPCLPVPAGAATGATEAIGVIGVTSAPGAASPVTASGGEGARTAPAPHRRTAPRLGALAVAVALAVGIPAWTDYRFYRSGAPAPHHHPVEPGDSGTLTRVSWTAEIEQTDTIPELGEAGPGRRWLKVTLGRTALDAEGLTRRGDPEVGLVHPDGRRWEATVIETDLPLEIADLRVGVSYRYEVAGVVPEEVADEVEVHVVPGASRIPPEEEGPAETSGRAGAAGSRDEVLVFRR
ncbi:hypothetical protein ACFOWE_19205 [Planomonospora corallina]|uniref:Uncharacterized protein n=1 Tax=Planomonospora corallina TaxID=1806052 RepID=A0ABV8I8B5_9ACTN